LSYWLARHARKPIATPSASTLTIPPKQLLRHLHEVTCECCLCSLGCRVVPVIQAAWRGWFVRHRTHAWIYGQIAAQREVVHRTKMGIYATELQRLFRGYKGRIVAKTEKGELPHLRLRDIAAAKFIQAAVRRFLFRLLAWRVRTRRVKRRREVWLRKWKRGYGRLASC
jgi:hypothetical protein